MFPTFILAFQMMAVATAGVAPGDEEQKCRDLRAEGAAHGQQQPTLTT